ncbi:hypothetical protein FSP39_005357 [Pinctada imbricata]|uniref:Leucine carboxyl methyltransferase 1 n=1 Tax=Pinctada imbricata TaxID=66713 RepID=A0AA89C0K4_PINIB|nr:hypothetical protein FSP39_005357 [Pinctada imbricata]
MASDDAVRATNDDAANCKRYAVEKKYWSDPYIAMLTPRSSSKHAPEISRGYYARVTAMRSMLQKFIKITGGECQIVNLGAGFDTNYWLLKDIELSAKAFVEVDFPTVTAKKVFHIKKHASLLEKIAGEDGDIQLSKSEIHATDYHLVECNLRNLNELKAKLHDCHIELALPTLFIAECVLVYIDVSSVNEILKWIAESFTTALFINYEQVNMTDRFGQVMIENLKSRDCYLSGVDACASLDSQKERFTSQGWEGADGMDMAMVYNCLPQADVHRIEKIEFMDEKELLEQLLKHYCFVWGWKDPNNIGLAALDLT